MTYLSNGKSTTDNDSLTSIRGIGAAKKLWLESLGIRTIADLAEMSSEALKLRLKQAGYTISSSEIEGWLVQTQALLDTSPSSAAVTDTSAASDSQAETVVGSTDWDLITSFQVESQASFAVQLQSRQVDGKTEQRTLIHHQETGKQETIAGISQDKLQSWILNQLRASLHIEVQSGETTDEVEPIAVEIRRLQFFQTGLSGQPMIASKTMPLFPDALIAEQPFSLEISIQLPEATRSNLGNQLMILHAACEARHLASGQLISLGETRLNAIGRDTTGFTLLIPDMVLTAIGNYRLRVMATIENLPATPDLFKVPILELESASPPACLV